MKNSAFNGTHIIRLFQKFEAQKMRKKVFDNKDFEMFLILQHTLYQRHFLSLLPFHKRLKDWLNFLKFVSDNLT